MKSASLRILLIEALVLMLLATLIGVGINRKILTNAWTGKAIVSSPAAPVQGAIPLPLGLMQVKELFDGKEAVIIDSRDRKTFSAGHVNGARSIPLNEAAKLLPEFSGSVPKNTMLVIYCNGYGCEDSVELGKKFIAEGYAAVYYFDGGFPAWRDANYPVAGGDR